MFLQKLSEYADRIGMPPAQYQNVPIRYLVQLDSNGRLVGKIIDLRTDEDKRGKARLVPDLKRSVAIAPKLLADNAEYVLGIGRETSKVERVQEQHRKFVALARDCAEKTGTAEVQAVVQFLTSLDVSVLPLPEDFDPSGNLTFQVDGVYPVDLPAVRAYWAKAASVPEDTPTMQCLVCGQMRPPVERLTIAIKGIPGGQATGMALISANARAFESYGLEASLIAPTCEECGQRFGNALNALLRQEQTHLYASPIVYIFWARENTPFSLGTLLSKAEPEDVKRFLTAAWRSSPEGARLAITPFYAAALSASGARVVLRDWIETTLEQAQFHLARYFRLQRLRDAFSGEMRWFPLLELARATTNGRSRKEEPPAQVIQALLHVALKGGPLPEWLLYQAVRRVRAEQKVTAAHAALIKMVLLSQSSQWDTEQQQGSRFFRNGDESAIESSAMSELTDMGTLDEKERRAYACGRLLAEIETIQRDALGRGINATVVDRYYGTASSAPASVFGRLLRTTQAHMSKLRREREGAYLALDRRLQEIMRDLPFFPATLTLREQGLFALGYYHQKAEHTRARLANQANKAQQTNNGDEASGDETGV